MQQNPWNNYRTAPVPLRIFSWITVAITLLFIFHTLIQLIYTDEIGQGTFYIASWVQEIYLYIWNGLPVFLVLTGDLNTRKKFRPWVWTFIAIYSACYILNIFNVYEWVDIRHLQYPQSVALLGLLTLWLINLFQRKKNILDILKFIWMFGLTYAFIVPRFVQSNHESGNFFLASLFTFPLMMSLGLYYFFRKPKSENIA